MLFFYRQIIPNPLFRDCSDVIGVIARFWNSRRAEIITILKTIFDSSPRNELSHFSLGEVSRKFSRADVTVMCLTFPSKIVWEKFLASADFWNIRKYRIFPKSWKSMKWWISRCKWQYPPHFFPSLRVRASQPVSLIPVEAARLSPPLSTHFPQFCLAPTQTSSNSSRST